MNAPKIVNKLLEADVTSEFDRYSDDIAASRTESLKAFCNEVEDLLTVVDDGNGEQAPGRPANGYPESRYAYVWERLVEVRRNFGL